MTEREIASFGYLEAIDLLAEFVHARTKKSDVSVDVLLDQIRNNILIDLEKYKNKEN